MNILGHVVVIKRTGADGTPIPLTNISCSIGRNSNCDIRVILPTVSSQHCRIDVDPCGKAYVTNVSQCNHTLVNDSPLSGEEVCILGHKDIITIADRQFRWEYPEGSVLAVSVKKDEVIHNKTPSPTTRPQVRRRSFNEFGGTKRKNVEADVLEMQEAKRKKVSFGPQLNPEHFDKLLPPATPVSKGEKPNAQNLPYIPDSPCLNTTMRKSLRASNSQVEKPTSEESVMDTPTKSLLRRRSPTPVKPYIARSLGLFASKVLDTQSNTIEGSVANGLVHDVPAVDNCPKVSPEKSPRLLSIESKKLSKLYSSKCPEAAMDSYEVSRTSKSSQSDLSKKRHKEVIASKIKKHSPLKSPKRCSSGIESESSQNITASSMNCNDMQTFSIVVMSKDGTGETSPKKVIVSKTSPKKAESPEIQPGELEVYLPIISVKKLSLGATPKNITSLITDRKIASPRGTPKVICSKVASRKITSPKVALKKVVTPRNIASTNYPSRKVSSPKSPSRKIALLKSPSRKIALLKSPSREMASPKSPATKVTSPVSPKAPARKSRSPARKRASPKSPSRNISSPKSPSRKRANSKSPSRKMASPKSPARKVALPKSPAMKVASPKAPAWKITSPKSPSRKITSPKSPSRKMTSPKSLSRKMTSPKSPSRKMTSPIKEILSTEAPRKMFSSKSPPKGIASPESPRKMVSPPKEMVLPKLPLEIASPSKMIVSPFRKKSSTKSVSKDEPLLESPKFTKVSPKSTVQPKSPFNNFTVDNTSPKITSPSSLSKVVVSPTSPPKMVASQISPTKLVCSKVSPLSSPKKTLLPKVSPKSSPSKPLSPLKKALLKEVTALLESQRGSPKPTYSRRSGGNKTPRLCVTKNLIRTALTPKSGHKKSISKGKTPTKLSRKTPKKSWADVLKSGLMAHGIQQGKLVLPRRNATHSTHEVKLRKKRHSVEVTKNVDLGRVTTGHANSPAPIFIHKKISKTPRLFKKGRKIPIRAEVSDLISKGDAYLDGLAGLLATPKDLKNKQITAVTNGVDENAESPGEITSPKSKRRSLRVPVVSDQDNKIVKIQDKSPKPVTMTPEYSSSVNKTLAISPSEAKTPAETSANDFEESLGDSLGHSSPTTSNVPPVGERPLSYISTSTSYMNYTNFDFSSVETPDVTEDNYVSPLETPASLKNSERVLRSYKDKFLVTSPEDIPLETDVTNFDFENAHTPDFSQDHFVSPMSTKCKHTSPRGNYSTRKSPRNHDLSGMNMISTPNLVNETPKGTHPDVHELKRLLHTPKTAFSTPRQRGVGLNVSFETNATGIDESSEENRTADSETEVSMAKVEKQLKSPSSSLGSPKAADVQDLTETVCASAKNSTGNYCINVSDLKLQMTPKLILQNIRASAEFLKADDTFVDEVDNLVKSSHSNTSKSPKADYTDVRGVKQLLKTPKINGKEHKADYTNVVGLKKLLQTPKPNIGSPKADYTNVSGVKRLMEMPNATQQNIPEADYTNVRGVKRLLKTPKADGKEQGADYTNVVGLRKLLQTPKPRVESPEADYTDVSGVKRLMKTPKSTCHKSPKADYTNVAGMKKLMNTPKAPVPEYEADDTHVIGIRKILRSPKLPPESPKADYANVVGIKKLFKTPNKVVPKPCTPDYRNVAGIKRLLRSPRQMPKETEAVLGIQKNRKTRRKAKEIIPDYREPKGLKRLMATPKQQFSPLSDYTNVAGLKNILATPRSPIKSPKADYTNVYGLRALMRTPKVHEDFVDISLDGLDQLLKTPLTDQTNVIVGRTMDLNHSKQSSGRKLRRSPQVVSPATSSPSENIPPMEEIRRNAEALEKQVQNGGSTPRRSQRKAKVKVEQVTTPVKRGRSRKLTNKETKSVEASVHDSVLKLIKASPVILERRLRSRKEVCYMEGSLTEIIQKSKATKTKTEHEHHDEANKAATKKKQHSSPNKVNSVEVNLDNSTQVQVDCSPLPSSRRHNDKHLPTRTHSRRGKQNTLISKQDSTEPASLIVESTSGNDVDSKSEESVTTRRRRKQAESVITEQTKTQTPRGRGQKKAGKGNEDSAKEASKVEAQSVHDDKPVNTGSSSPELNSENKPTPRKLRKRKVQDGELDFVQVGELSCQIQESFKKEITSRRGRGKAAEKPENSSKRQLRGRKNCSTQASVVQDEQESEMFPNGLTESPEVLKGSASDCQTKRKRGKKINSDVMHETVTKESSEDLGEPTEKKRKPSIRSSNKKVKNQDLQSESIKSDVKEPDSPQHQTNLAGDKKDTDTVDTPTRKTRLMAMTEEVETTRVTRSRNKGTKTGDILIKMSRQTRSCK